ncbi:MAG TPA: hypothetical protein VLJ11_06335 [Bryobacteraceae bacterium]|nr:hypothetical protein [Bryobacteraceae bacterium]
MQSLILIRASGMPLPARVKARSRIPAVLALVVALIGSGALAQQSQSTAGAQPGGSQHGMMSGHMGRHSDQMTAMHNQMMADMKVMDAKLDQKVAAMNAAQGNAKIEAMAAVINEMVTQRKEMMTRMSGMHDRMMQGMNAMSDQSSHTHEEHSEEPK